MGDGSVDAKASVAAAVAIAGNAKGVARHYFSAQYLYTARWFSDEAGRIEDRLAGVQPFHPMHHGYVIGSITASCAFLEATVNEVFLDIVDGFDRHNGGQIAADTKRTIRWLWTEGKAEEAQILAKYNAILGAADAPLLAKGENPYQDAQTVIDIRNALTHFKVYSVGAGSPHPLSKKFAAPRFPLNRMMIGYGNELFPHHVLGHGCAEWAWKSCKALADEFSLRLGIQPNYQRTDLEATYGEVDEVGP